MATDGTASSRRLVVGVVPPAGSEAARAGVSMGDAVVAIGGVATAGMDLDEAEWRVAEADEVTVQPRAQGKQRLAVRVPHSATPSSPRRRLVAEAYGGGGANGPPVGYLRLGEFTASSAVDARAALLRLRDVEGCERLVLDLRGNGGGSFSSCLGLAGLLLGPSAGPSTPGGADARDAGVLVAYTTDQHGAVTEHRTRQPRVWHGPIEVWVDWQTASASEIVVGAVQDLLGSGCGGGDGAGRATATVVGPPFGPTFGKGIGQTLYGLSDGGGLALTVSHTATPLGRDLHAGGLTPDTRRLQLSSVLGNAALPIDVALASFEPPPAPPAASAAPATAAATSATASLSPCAVATGSGSLSGSGGGAVEGAATPGDVTPSVATTLASTLTPWRARSGPAWRAKTAPLLALGWASAGAAAAWSGTRRAEEAPPPRGHDEDGPPEDADER